MLREVKSKQLKSRLSYFQTTSAAGPVISGSVGVADSSSLSVTGGFVQSVALREPFRQKAVYIASQGTQDGGCVAQEGATSVSTLSSSVRDVADSAVEGLTNYLCIGANSPTIDSLPASNILSSIDRTRLIWGKISSAGVVQIGTTDFSVTTSATGLYTITYKKAFGRNALAFATPIYSDFIGPKITNQTAKGCTVFLGDNSSTGVDCPFYILAVGTDSREETGRGDHPVLNSQRKPRIECAQFTVTGGTPTLTVGTKIVALTDNGTGDFSLTLATPFKREFASFALSGGAGTTGLSCVLTTANTTSVTRIGTWAITPAITDPTLGSAVNVIMIGSDDVGIY